MLDEFDGGLSETIPETCIIRENRLQIHLNRLIFVRIQEITTGTKSALTGSTGWKIEGIRAWKEQIGESRYRASDPGQVRYP
jgi:hypothetical protein